MSDRRSRDLNPDALAAQIRTALGDRTEGFPRAVTEDARSPNLLPEIEADDIFVRDIDPRGSNVRARMDMTELHQLAASLKQHGMLEPVVVQALPKTRGYRYRLIAGFRRVAAARLVPLTVVPARIIRRELSETEVQELQLTENLQREAMSMHDIVASIDRLRAAGLTQQQVADRLGFSLGKVRLYLQLGDVMRQNKALSLYVDQGLIGITHFQAAVELLTKARRKIGAVVDTPALREEVLAQAEELFTAMLNRLVAQKRLTAKTISTEVARLLALSGVEEPPAPRDATEARSLPPQAVLSSFERLDVTRLALDELERVVAVGQVQVKAAKARLRVLQKG